MVLLPNKLWLLAALLTSSLSSVATETRDSFLLRGLKGEDGHRELSVASAFSSLWNKFFGRSTYCHSLGDGDRYETRQVLKLFGFLHDLHGDQSGPCALLCTELCNHQPCMNDFALSENDNVCECISSSSSTADGSMCGANAQCTGDDQCRCESGYEGDPPTTGCTPKRGTTSKLATVSAETLRQSYESCDELRGDLTEAARYLSNAAIERNVRMYFYNDYYYGPPIQGPITDPIWMVPIPENVDGGGNQGPIDDDSYETNVQVDGVGEPDIVKSDGSKVFAAYGHEIIVLDAETVTITNRTKLPDDAQDETCSYYSGKNIVGLLLNGERLVVITNSYCGGYPVPLDGVAPILQQQENTKVLVYNKANMSLLDFKEIRGNYISARSVGDSTYIVTKTWLDTYTGFIQYLNPYNQDIYGSEFDEPTYRTKAVAEAERRIEAFVDQLVSELDCKAIQKLVLMQNSASMLSFMNVLESMATIHSFETTDMTGTLNFTSMLLSSSGGITVYGSADRLVLAVRGYWIDDTSNESTAREHTFFLTFLLTGPTVAFSSLRTVTGYLLNQFSIDHSKQNGKDFIRVATSTQARWGSVDGIWQRTEESTNQLMVLEISDDDAMPVVGQLNDMGKPGERIYSVRFLGDRGFVVTFEQIDPFITLDLSDPLNPQVVGELEILGFSNYLHPIGNHLILGVGQGANDIGQTTGLQVSLFDVSTLSAPTRIQNYIEEGGYSDAQYNHLAFRYLPDSQILILPLTIYDYENGQGIDGFRLYKIDEDDGITPYMDITHASGNYYYGCYSSEGYFQPRSLVFGGDLMTFKAHSIISHDLTTKVLDEDPINLDIDLDPENCSPYYFFDDVAPVGALP